MDILTIILFFVVIPIAVIISSIALQRLINSPVLVSAIVFITFIIVALLFPASTALLILAAIALGIIALITAFLTCILSGVLDRICDKNCTRDNDAQNNNDNISNNINRCSRLCCRRRICRRR